MRLALAAGRPDAVDELGRRLTSRQVAEWQAFEVIEGGIGGRAVWFAVAQFLALWAESRRDPKKKAQAFAPKDFLPWIERASTMTPRAFRAQFRVVKKKGA